MFRHERPQKGRYRQFHQIDVEALGHAGPDVDAEQILMCRALWRDLGLVEGRDVRLELNSLGQPSERLAHRAALIAHFEKHADALDDDARRRLHSNPLRILDSKNPAMQAIIEAAPQLMDFLGAASLAHFDAVRAALDAAGLAYRVNPRLVRGLDYYNLTVFEWVTDHLGSQGTVCGGGRYDGLFEQLGGKPTPAIGWGMGVERMLLLLEAVGVAMPAPAVDVYAVVPGAAGAARGARGLRDAARRRPVGADARRRRRRLGRHEGPVPPRRRQRRAPCAGVRRRRAGARRGRGQGAARRRRAAAPRAPGRPRLVGPHPHRIIPGLPEDPSPWPPNSTSKNRSSSTSSRRSGTSTAT